MKILILGGGFGGIYTLKYLGKFLNKNEVILVNDNEYFLFTPLLIDFVCGFVSEEAVKVYFKEISKSWRFKFISGKVSKIDLNKKIVYVNQEEINYEVLVICLGAEVNYYNIIGKENCWPLKSLDSALKLKSHIFEIFKKEKYKENFDEFLTFVIVGGGATGVELAGNLSDLFFKIMKNKISKKVLERIRIILIEGKNEILTQFSEKMRKAALLKLKEKGIKLILGKIVTEVGENFVKLGDEIIYTRTTIWTAGIKPNLPEIIGDFLKDNSGRLLVNENLQLLKSNSEAYNDVFCLGDIACFLENQKQLSQSAQVTTKQAKVLAFNIKNLNNKKTFKYKHSGDIISLGFYYAVAQIFNIFISGFFVSLLKRFIYLVKMISFPHKIKILENLISFLFFKKVL